MSSVARGRNAVNQLEFFRCACRSVAHSTTKTLRQTGSQADLVVAIRGTVHSRPFYRLRPRKRHGAPGDCINHFCRLLVDLGDGAGAWDKGAAPEQNRRAEGGLGTSTHWHDAQHAVSSVDDLGSGDTGG